MTSACLLTISLLLLLNLRDCAFTGCVSAEEAKTRMDRFEAKFRERKRAPAAATRENLTCVQVAAMTHSDLRTRALSPWRYSVNRDDARAPRELVFAVCVCVCHGCVIDGHVDEGYNSVLVSEMTSVLRRTPCPHHPHRYEVKKERIQVPVACTCATPKYRNSLMK